MIINIDVYSYPYIWDRDDSWTVLDTETNEYIESYNPYFTYYPNHLGKSDDRYIRMVALDIIDICETENDDDLSPYGFEIMNIFHNGVIRWYKNKNHKRKI